MASKIDVEKLISFSDDLSECLKNEKDIHYLNHCIERFNTLRYPCRSDHAAIQSSVEDYQKKIDTCKRKTEAAKAEIAADSEIDLLQKELDEELQREILLKEELRGICNQIDDLEEQRSSIEERRQVLKKLEQDEMKAQMELSMYASVTNIIPNLNDLSNISGHIVDKENKKVEKFELSSRETDFDMCNIIWKTITR